MKRVDKRFSNVILFALIIFLVGVGGFYFASGQSGGVSHDESEVITTWAGSSSNLASDLPVISNALTSQCPAGQVMQGYDSSSNIVCASTSSSQWIYETNPPQLFSFFDTSDPGFPGSSWATYDLSSMIPSACSSTPSAVLVRVIGGETGIYMTGENSPPTVSSLNVIDWRLASYSANNGFDENDVVINLESNLELKLRILATDPSTLTATSYLRAWYC